MCPTPFVPGGLCQRDSCNFNRNRPELANGQTLAYVYSREDAAAAIAKVLTLDEARRIAANIAKLPELLSSRFSFILKNTDDFPGLYFPLGLPLSCNDKNCVVAFSKSGSIDLEVVSTAVAVFGPVLAHTRSHGADRSTASAAACNIQDGRARRNKKGRRPKHTQVVESGPALKGHRRAAAP